MTTDEIINYVMYTSHNTNPAVLRDLLNSIESGGGDSDFKLIEVTIENINDPIELQGAFFTEIIRSVSYPFQSHIGIGMTTQIVTVLSYKGVAAIGLPQDATIIEMDDNYEYDSIDNMIIIREDGYIKTSYTSPSPSPVQ